MGTIAQYAVSIFLFIAIPVGVQVSITKFNAWRATRGTGDLSVVPVQSSVE